MLVLAHLLAEPHQIDRHGRLARPERSDGGGLHGGVGSYGKTSQAGTAATRPIYLRELQTLEQTGTPEEPSGSQPADAPGGTPGGEEPSGSQGMSAGGDQNIGAGNWSSWDERMCNVFHAHTPEFGMGAPEPCRPSWPGPQQRLPGARRCAKFAALLHNGPHCRHRWRRPAQRR